MPPQCPEAFKLLFDIINSTQYLLVENHFRKFSNVRLYKKKITPIHVSLFAANPQVKYIKLQHQYWDTEQE